MATPAHNQTEAVLAAMSDPAFYPHSPGSVERRDTHLSTVFLADDLVYKVKRPVVLPFVDYGTLARRHFFCHEELRLNRRLAPDLYLAVRPILDGGGGATGLGPPDAPADGEGDRNDRGERPGDRDGDAAGDGRVIEYAVEMRRLPRDRDLATLLARGAVGEREIDRIAETLVAFHAAAPAGRDRDAYLDGLAAGAAENFATAAAVCDPAALEDRRLTAVRGFSTAFLAAKHDLLRRRWDDGRVRECHGDLRCEHVVIDQDRVLVYDCVEFSESLRTIDVAADLAFLAMDLERLGGRALADRLVRRYVEFTGDGRLAELLPYYASYRAWVRGKVDCLRAAGDPPPGADRDRASGSGSGSASASASASAREHFELAHRLTWRARLPLVLVICGVSASGKSALAERLAADGGPPVLSSDRVRKELAGVEPTARASGVYTSEHDRETYGELGRRAAAATAAGGGAIVDATFRRRDQRAAFRSALGDIAAPVLYCECRAPAGVLRARAEARLHDPARVSDADIAVVERHLAEFEPLDEIPSRSRAVIATDGPFADALTAIEAIADRAPALRLPARGREPV